MPRKGSILPIVLLIIASIIPVAHIRIANGQPPSGSSPPTVICGFVEDDDHDGLPEYLHQCSTEKVYSWYDAKSAIRTPHTCVILVNPVLSGNTIVRFDSFKIIADCSGCPRIPNVASPSPPQTAPSSSSTSSSTQTVPSTTVSPASTQAALVAQPFLDTNSLVTLIGVMIVILAVAAYLVHARALKNPP